MKFGGMIALALVGSLAAETLSGKRANHAAPSEHVPEESQIPTEWMQPASAIGSSGTFTVHLFKPGFY
jgi:hypothetical protein